MKKLKFQSVQKLWSKEWLLRFISLFLAILLWYFIGGEDAVDKTVMVPIEIINMPKDLIISNKFKKEIAVAVRGPRSLLLDMGKREITRQVDLSDATPGTRVINISNKSIPVSRGVKVLRVQPSSLILSLDKLIQKKFTITPVIVGHVAHDYLLKELRITPDVITITGPQTELSQVESLKTIPINIGGMTESVQKQIPLDLDPAIVDLIGETSITADILIAMETVEKTIDNVPVQVEIDGNPQKVEPSKVQVTLKIPKLMLKKDTDIRKLFSVTAVAVAPEDKQMKVQVVLPKKQSVPFQVVKIEPEFVHLVSTPSAPKTDNHDKKH